MFADDTAMVVEDFRRDLSRMYEIFKELAAAAHLQLNYNKCVFIPLFDYDKHKVQADLRGMADPLGDMSIGKKGKYLGFSIGPGKGDSSWQGALDKATKRVSEWDWAPLGFFFATQVWNTFVASLFGFVAQLERPPPGIKNKLAELLLRAGHGPPNWCSDDDLTHLRRGFGFHGEFKDVITMAQAAMFRTTAMEDSNNGGLRCQERATQLKEEYRKTKHFIRSREWGHWYERAFVTQLAEHQSKLRETKGITQGSIERELSHEQDRPWTPTLAKLVKRSFQRQGTKHLADDTPFQAEARVRRNLRRFGLLDRREAARSLKRLRSLQLLVPPRVWAATFGALWNRWFTARRTQRIHSKCLLGCEWGDDSVEHYVDCPQVVQFAKHRLHLTCRFGTRRQYWLMAAGDDPDNSEPSWWARQSLLHYAVSRTTNAARIAGGLAAHEAQPALWQATLEGCKGSRLGAAINTAGRKHWQPTPTHDMATSSAQNQTSTATTIPLTIPTPPRPQGTAAAAPSTTTTIPTTVPAIPETATARFRRFFDLFML